MVGGGAQLEAGDSLFDRHRSEGGLVENLAYMSRTYGFFVPFVENVAVRPPPRARVRSRAHAAHLPVRTRAVSGGRAEGARAARSARFATRRGGGRPHTRTQWACRAGPGDRAGAAPGRAAGRPRAGTARVPG